MEQLDERGVDDAATIWRATFTGDATLRVRGAQSGVAGTFRYMIYELQDDHSDDRMSGTRITVGEMVTGSLVFSGDNVADIDWFGFVGVAGIEYNVVLLAAESDNVLTMPRGTVRVYQGDGATALGSGNQGDPATFVAQVSGDYYVEISGPQTSVDGTYELHVEQVGGSPVRVTPNPGGYASGVIAVVVEVLGDGTASADSVAAAIELDSGRTVVRIWMFTTNSGWLLWAPGPVDLGLSEFSGISAVFPVFS